MKNLIFSEQDRDEQGFLKLPASPSAPPPAPPVSAPRPRPALRRPISPAQARQRRHMLAVGTGALVMVVALFALMAMVSRLAARPTLPAVPTGGDSWQSRTPAPTQAARVAQQAIVARWDYTDPANVTALPPGQAIDHVIGHAAQGTWLYVALDPAGARRVWIAAADVPQLVLAGSDLTVPPTPIPAPVVVRVLPAPVAPAPLPMVQEPAPPPPPVCTDQNVKELGFSAGWAVVWRGLPLGTVEAWSCVSAEEARQQAQQAEQAMILAYEQSLHPTATPRKAE